LCSLWLGFGLVCSERAGFGEVSLGGRNAAFVFVMMARCMFELLFLFCFILFKRVEICVRIM
jgi:hypothetical protein